MWRRFLFIGALVALGIAMFSSSVPAEASGILGHPAVAPALTPGPESSPVFWYLSRTAAMVAYVLLFFSVCMGLGLRSQRLDRVLGVWRTFDLHRLVSFLALAFVGLHIFSLLGDTSFHFGIKELLLPFFSPYQPTWVAVGVFGFYALLAVTCSWYARRAGERAWRILHRLSLPLFFAILIHGVIVGSDTSAMWVQALYISTGTVVVVLLGIRLLSRPEYSACEVTCPAHVDTAGYIALVRNGRFTEALSLIRDRLPLAGVLGRVCSAPCEKRCRRGGFDEPLAIRELKRAAFEYGTDEIRGPLPIAGKERVAIIGSGPAGLSAAYDLARRGYRATIFEALPVIGGMMAVGIPRYRLPPKVLERDINYLKNLGIEVKTGVTIGKDISIDDLFREGHSSVFIAVGAHRGRKLPIPGTEAENVLAGTSFLRAVNSGQPVKLGKRVTVLGGGNIAIDCARMARRLGAEAVELACLESYEKMPALPSERAEAEKEGITIYPSRTFTRVVCQDNHATGIECRTVRRMEFDKEGRLTLETVEGSEHVLPCDTLIFAIGQSPELDYLLAGSGVEVTKRGTIAVDPLTQATSRPGVFAGGDAVTGTAWIIDAVAAGQRAAEHIVRYLRGETCKESAPILAKALDITEIPLDPEKAHRRLVPQLELCSVVGDFRETVLGCDRKSATAEAGRCLNCAGRH